MKKIFIILLIFISFALFPFKYTVQSGDTLYSISKKYGLPVDDLVSINGLDDKVIKVGQKIEIPLVGNETQQSSAQPQPMQNDSKKISSVINQNSTITQDTVSSYFDYTVQSGDTLYGLARKYSISVDSIIDMNTLSDRNLKVGQKIKIPTTTKNFIENKATIDSSQSQTVLKSQGLNTDKNGIMWPHGGQRKTVEGKFPGWVIDAKTGDNIISVSEGLVVYSQEYSHIGMIIMVQSDEGYIYTYGGASRLFAQKGDRIKKGAVLGTVGISYKDNKTEVYYSVWKGNYLSTPPRT